MEGYIDENRWIDLSGLPRKMYGNKTRIDWKNSVGCILPFKYKKVKGNLEIRDYEMTKNGNSYVYVYVENYIPTATKIQAGALMRFELHHFFKHKIIDYAPWMQQYLANPMDAYKYCCSSNKYILTKCPACGYTSSQQLARLYCRGFTCDMCDAGISFPNRLMRSILNYLHVDFIPEVGSRHGFKWMGKYLYDFYFCDTDGNDILIEMDGGFHRYEEQQKVDAVKTELANLNNCNLIRIDCQYRDNNKLEYIKKNIVNSKLSNILSLDLINWNQCFLEAQTNIFLHKYLHRGRDIGICLSYNPIDEPKRRKFKRIAEIKDGTIIRVFSNANEVEQQSNMLYGKTLHKEHVRAVCSGHMGSYFGLYFQYITKEEYEHYKMINNEVVLKEVV